MGNSKELSEDGRTIVEFHKLESSLGAIYYQLQIWLTSDQIVFKYKLFRIVTTLIEPSPSDDLEEQARKHRGSKCHDLKAAGTLASPSTVKRVLRQTRQRFSHLATLMR